MKNPPYKEIIDLNAERKEYSRLCNGKSRIFKVYTEWEDYIKRLLSGFNSPKDMYNFKHYCINAARAQEKAPEMFLAYIGLMIPLYLDAIWEGMPAFITLFFLVGILAYAIIQNKKLAKESCFFKDIIDIIEMIEKDNR